MKYNERDAAKLHTRAHTVSITFPHSGEGLAPEISFAEQDVVTADGVEYPVKGTTNRAVDWFVPETYGESFQLYDLTTEEQVPEATATYAEVASLLYSLYFHVAAKRDARLAPQPEIEE